MKALCFHHKSLPQKSRTQLEVGSQGFTVQFDQLKEIPQDQLKQRQDELEKKLREVQTEVRRSSTTRSTVRKPQLTSNINGTWYSNDGASYTIRQYGTAITLQEISPGWGVTAVGQGTIYQQTINLDYVTALYTTGKATLRVSDDGNQISGMFTDFSTGMKLPARLYR
jgi:hypothetical protein